MAKVRFQPLGLEADWAAGESLFDVARRLGVPVSTACVGNATCGLCRMKVLAGAEHLSPLTGAERNHLGNVTFITHQRLSCQVRLVDPSTDGAVEVEVPLIRLRGA